MVAIRDHHNRPKSTYTRLNGPKYQSKKLMIDRLTSRFFPSFLVIFDQGGSFTKEIPLKVRSRS